MKQSSTPRVRAWRENIRRKAAAFDAMDERRIQLLARQAERCAGTYGAIAAVLDAFEAEPSCFLFPTAVGFTAGLPFAQWASPPDVTREEMDLALEALASLKATR